MKLHILLVSILIFGPTFIPVHQHEASNQAAMLLQELTPTVEASSCIIHENQYDYWNYRYNVAWELYFQCTSNCYAYTQLMNQAQDWMEYHSGEWSNHGC